MRQRGAAVLDASAGSSDDITGGVARVKLTEEERANVNELIRQAKSLEEIERFEKMLNEGKIPGQ